MAAPAAPGGLFVGDDDQTFLRLRQRDIVGRSNRVEKEKRRGEAAEPGTRMIDHVGKLARYRLRAILPAALRLVRFQS